MAGYADFQPLLSDARVRGLAERLFDKYHPNGLPDDVDFLTYIQPPTTTERNGVAMPIPEVAVFAVIVDNPRYPGKRVMKTASAWLQDWQAMDLARGHYVSGRVDPAAPIFDRLVRESIETLNNLREMN